MKRAFRFALFFAILALILSCSNPSLALAPPAAGSIKVSIPSGEGRSIDPLTSAMAQANVTTYQVYAFDPASSSYPSVVTITPPATSATMNMPVGSYSVLVAAVSGSNSYLLGSGETKAVSVASGVTTPVTVTVNPVYFAFTVTSPPQIGQNSSIGITLSGNAGCPSVQVGYFYWTIYDGVTQDANSTVYLPSPFLGSPASEYSASVTIPLGFTVSAATSAISIYGGNPRVVEGSATFNLTSYFFGYGYCPAAINGNYLETFTSVATTGLGVNVLWGASY